MQNLGDLLTCYRYHCQLYKRFHAKTEKRKEKKRIQNWTVQAQQNRKAQRQMGHRIEQRQTGTGQDRTGQSVNKVTWS